MSKQTIQLGVIPTGEGGDTPRSANVKINSNFDEIYTALGGTGTPAGLPAAIPIERGGTGSTTSATARTALGLGSAAVENVMPVAKGGTGAATPAAARTALGLGSAAVAAIVGTVAQSGGVPTGAIIERGSNASGSYTKFADGTIFISASLTITIALTVAQDGFFIGATPVFGFPATLIGTPEFTVSARAQTVSSQPNVATSTTWQGILMSMTSRSITVEIIMTAKGRWFA